MPPPSETPAPPRVSTSYTYVILTDERVKSWADTGRQTVIQHAQQSIQDQDTQEMDVLFEEFTRSVIDGRIEAVDGGLCVKEILGAESSVMTQDAGAFDLHGRFLDAVATMTDGESDAPPPLGPFLDNSGVSHDLMREVLEVPLLSQLGILRDTFSKLAIRYATNLLYRQANYNLLREETEGYSKLTTELFATSSLGPPTSEAAEATFEKIKAFIGTFDLDVGRVLDVILDVFAAVLIKQYRFFIKLLRVSSWWPRNQRASPVFSGGLPNWALPGSTSYVTSEEDQLAIEEAKHHRDLVFWERARDIHVEAFFELGGRQLTESERRVVAQAPDSNDADLDVETQWMRITKTLPPQGNKTAAHLLGFKLRFYASDSRAEDDVLPANLLYLAALLIKVGFISLCDLYPHLWPPDDEMEQLKERKLREIAEKERANRPGGGSNPLANAAALSDDTVPAPGHASRARDTPSKLDSTPQTANDQDDQEKKHKLPEPMEQKIALLVCLLTIGALPEALFMLGRYPWMIDADPLVLDRLHRILHHSIHRVYADSKPVASSSAECPTKAVAALDQSGVPKGSVKVARIVPKRVLRWPFPDQADSNENQNYRFYWEEWADNIPMCRNVDDVFTLCSSLLNVSGVNIGKDESLLSKLASIGVMSLHQDSSQANRDRWQDLLRRLLVPALSMTKANSAVVYDIWDLLRRYPIATRYIIYADWFEGQISRLPAIKKAFHQTRVDTLGIMKRLSVNKHGDKTQSSAKARSLAKATYSSPGVVFKVALDQIESYANLIDAFVECAKYFTDLAYDVLIWSLLSSLGGRQRSRTSETSVLLTSKWLQALSQFSGEVFRRYSVMTPTPVLLYVNDQLLRGNSTDLIILKNLISSMGGVIPTTDFNDDQILAMVGGETLRRQTLVNAQDRRFDSVKSSKRLMKALIDSKLAGQLLINIAQYRQAAIYKVSEDMAHIKYLSSVVDDSHQILAQYLDLLRSNLEPTEFDSLVPPIDQLMSDYGLEIGLAFLIGRASLSYMMMLKEEQARPQPSQSTSQAAAPQAAQEDGDVAMSDAHTQATAKPDGEPDKASREKIDEATPTALQSQVNGRLHDPFLDVLQPIIDSIERSRDASAWKTISPEFYVMFWALQLGDLFVPEDRYQHEEDRAYAQAKEIMRDRRDMSKSGVSLKSEKHRELIDIVKQLGEEKAKHKKTFTRNKILMIRQFKTWFSDTGSNLNASADAIIEQCLLPRLRFSPADAEYCHKMLRFLHDFGASNFKLMTLYDRFFNANRLRCMLFTCTVREAEYLGRFLRCVLGDLSRWHKDKAAYEKDAFLGPQPQQKERTLHGFASEMDSDGKPSAFVEHAQFRDMLYGWHRNLNTALKSCLGGMEWMHIRNAITVLKSVLDYFPAVDFMAQQFTRQLKTITEREAASKDTSSEEEQAHRVDLSVAAQTALSELQKRKSKWVMVQGFRPNVAGDAPLQGKAAESSHAPASLRATAPEFKPGQAASSSNRTQAAAGDEDGEVKDGEAPKSLPKQSVVTSHGPPATSQKDALPSRPMPAASQARGPNNDRPTSRVASQSHGSNSQVPSSNNGTAASAGRADAAKPSSLPERPPVGLPSRPNVPLPNYVPPEQLHNSRGESRDSRDTRSTAPRDAREHRHGRDGNRDREPRDQRDARDARDARQDPSRLDRPRDLPAAPNRRTPPPNASNHRDVRDSRDLRDTRDAREAREVHRSGEKEWPGRADPPRRTDGPHESRESRPTRDRQPQPAPSGHGHDSPRTRDGIPIGPSASRPSGPEPAMMNPERAALLQNDRPDRSRQEGDRKDRSSRHGEPERPEFINPARAALIDDGRHPDWVGRDEPRDRVHSRPHSPVRRRDRAPETSTPEVGSSRDDRHGRPHPLDHRISRGETAATPPAGRGDRRGDRDGDRPGEGRHSMGHAPSRAPEPEANRPYQESNYGRLNPIPVVQEIPSGPRGRGRGIPRAPAASGPASIGRPEQRFPSDAPRAPTPPDRQPPTGPASGRPRRAPFEPNTPAGNAPTLNTPSGTPQGDRGRTLPQGASPGSSFSGTPSGPAGIHPDRLSQIAPPPPPPPPPGGPGGQGGPPHRYQNQPPRHSTPADRPAPSGPGARQASGSFGGPTADNAATGPPDRTRVGGGRRQLAGINNTLQQAQATMTEGSRGIRRGGSGLRTSLANSDAQILTGASPVSTPTNEYPEPVERGTANGEEPHRGDDRRRDRERGDRSGRSRRSSHERDRDRDRDRDREGHRDRDRESHRERDRERERSLDRERDKDSRGYRDRRSGASGPATTVGTGRDDREVASRRTGREQSGGSTAVPHSGARGHEAPGREALNNGGRELRHREGALPSRPDEWGSTRGGHRGGHRESGGVRDSAGRPHDDRRDRDDRGRKRRSEEGAGPPEREKRQRR